MKLKKCPVCKTKLTERRLRSKEGECLSQQCSACGQIFTHLNEFEALEGKLKLAKAII